MAALQVRGIRYKVVGKGPGRVMRDEGIAMSCPQPLKGS